MVTLIAMTRQVPTADQATITSILVSVGDIVLNTAAAILTGSTVLLAQALQGFADTVTASLLLVGVRRSRQKPDASHPFGYGRELFFWVLIASIMTLTFSGGFALSQGFEKIINPQAIEYQWVALSVLLIGTVTNGYSFTQNFRRVSAGIGSWGNRINRIIHSSLVESKSAMLIDLTGFLSGLFGSVAILLYITTSSGLFDGFGAVVIGLLTVTGALLLIIDLRDLIIGRSPRPEIVEKIKGAAESIDEVVQVLDLRATTITSGKFFVIIEAHFADELSTDQIEAATDTIKATVQKLVPQVQHIQVEAETPDKT
jgi:cation diffusion facilitator family transporter